MYKQVSNVIKRQFSSPRPSNRKIFNRRHEQLSTKNLAYEYKLLNGSCKHLIYFVDEDYIWCISFINFFFEITNDPPVFYIFLLRYRYRKFWKLYQILNYIYLNFVKNFCI